MLKRFHIAVLMTGLSTVLALVGGPFADAASPAPPPAELDREFMGMSIRDPWYEFNTNRDFPNAPNEAFQAEMGAVLEKRGLRDWAYRAPGHGAENNGRPIVSAATKSSDRWNCAMAPTPLPVARVAGTSPSIASSQPAPA